MANERIVSVSSLPMQEVPPPEPRNAFAAVAREIVRPLARIQRYHLSFEGYTFIMIMALVGFAAWHSGTNLLYLMFAMMIGFFLVQGMAVWLCLLGIDAERKMPQAVNALEEVRIPLIVRNRKRFFNSYSLRFLDYLRKHQPLGATFVASLRNHGSVATSYQCVFPNRGMATLKRMQVSTRYPFGFVRRTITLDRKDHILVFPPVADISRIAAELKVDFGELESREKGIGTDLYGLKEYTPGEAVRRVHWRSSAKAQRMMIMEYEKEDRQKISLVLPNVVDKQDIQDASIRPEFEKAVTLVASLCRSLIHGGYEVQLITGSGRVPYGFGSRHLLRLLRVCALLELTDTLRGTHVMPEHGSPLLRVLFAEGHEVWMNAPGALTIDVRTWDIRDRQFVPAGIDENRATA